MEIYGLKKDIAERATTFFRGNTGQRFEGAPSGALFQLQIARVTTEIAASTNGYMTAGEVQLLSWDSGGTSPVALSATDLGTVDAWSPFEEILPADTYCVIGKFPNGYVILIPLNYCPTSGAGGGGGDPI